MLNQQVRANATRSLPMRSQPAPARMPRKCADECNLWQEEESRDVLQRTPASPITVSSVPAIVHDVLSSPGQPLDAGTRAFMEPRFGYDFSKVRVHTDARAAESARQVRALAYTVGSDLVFASGRYRPEMGAGLHLLAHELTHVVQQAGFTPPMCDPAGSSSADALLEIGTSGSPQEREAENFARTFRDENMPARFGRFGLALQRQEHPTEETSQGNTQPTPRLTLQVPLNLVNFQLPFSDSPWPPPTLRSTFADQAYQPNVGIGLVHSWRRNPQGRGWDFGGFFQYGQNYALGSPPPVFVMPTPTTATRVLTAQTFQVYLQPAFVYISINLRNDRKFQGSAFGQLGGSYAISDIPGLAGWSISGQLGSQFSLDLTGWLQAVGTVALGYNLNFPDQPLPGSSSVQGNPFWTIGIGVQVQLPLLWWQPRRTPTPARTVDQPSRPEPRRETPSQRDQQQRQQQVPQPRQDTGQQTRQQQQPQPPSPPPIPGTMEVFFQLDRPRQGQNEGEAAILTAEGRSNLPAITQALAGDPTLKVQLVGSCSNEGTTDYNDRLGQRRVEWLAARLRIDSSRLANPAENDLAAGCRIVSAGLVSCGSTVADTRPNPRDRRVLARFFRTTP